MVEADFQREYNLDLGQPGVIEGMSWRRFATLLRGLGPQSASASRAWVRRYKDRGAIEAVRVVSGTKEEVSAAFVAQFGHQPKPKKAK